MREIKDKRRALLDAIYAIHLGDGRIRVDLRLAEDVERAWEGYDTAIGDALQAENERLAGELARVKAAARECAAILRPYYGMMGADVADAIEGLMDIVGSSGGGEFSKARDILDQLVSEREP